MHLVAGAAVGLAAQAIVLYSSTDAYLYALIVIGAVAVGLLIARRWWIALGLIASVLALLAWLLYVLSQPGAFRTVH